MKRSMLAIVLVVGAIAALVVGVAMAAFTDSDSQPVSMGAGTVSIEIAADPVDLNGMMPGDTVKQCVNIKNTGSEDVIFRVYLDNDDQDPEDFHTQLRMKVTLNPDECDHPESFEVYGAANNVLLDNAPLAIGKENALDNAHAAIDDEFPLFSEWAAVYHVEVTFDMTAGNEYNGASLSADLTVDATQASGQTDAEAVDWGELDD